MFIVKIRVTMSEKRLMLSRGTLDLILTEIFVLNSQFRSRKVLFPKYYIRLNLEWALLFRAHMRKWLACWTGRVV